MSSSCATPGKSMNDRYIVRGVTVSRTLLSSLAFAIWVMVVSLATFGATESFAQQSVVTDKCAADSTECKWVKLTLTIDRPKLNPVDIKKLQEAQRNNKVSE
jgi:hypothetical protein